MNSFCVYGLDTRIIKEGDDIVSIILDKFGTEPLGEIQEMDIIVIAESALATAEGAVVDLNTVVPSEDAKKFAEEYSMDPRVAEVTIRESDTIVGGIPGFLLCMKNGTLLPNAGIDGSNAPPGKVVLLPSDADGSAERIRREIFRRTGKHVGVIVADSRTHAMRLGCSGVAIGCSGIDAVVDERGRTDLFGRTLEVTERAVGDCISSACELVMGECDECMPFAVVRGIKFDITENRGVKGIDASECLFMGAALHADPALFDRENKT